MTGIGTVTFASFRLRPAERLLERDGAAVAIGSRALDLLIAMLDRPGAVVSQRELAAYAWPNLVVEDGNLRVSIAALRKALGDGQDGARYIVNVPGRGYSFVAPVERQGRGHHPGTGDVQPISPARLPPRLGRIVGREQVIPRLTELLVECRFVSIIGAGGLGKTTVAVEIAHALANSFEQAAFFVDLGALSDESFVSSTVAVTIGATFQAKDPIPALLRFLADRRIMLVLDNCEHVVDAVADLAERLHKAAPAVHLLVTSREALRAEGERVHQLAPLASPPEGEVTTAEALSIPATRLFMDCAMASGSMQPLTDADAAIVVSICRRLDGLPLAIELAGSQVGTHGLMGTAKLLDSRFELLWRGRRTAQPRHQTLRALHDWSFDLLSKRDRIVLERLAVFIGPLTLSAARCVAGDDELTGREVDEAITSLLSKSLITAAGEGAGYLRLLETTRSYALEKLEQAPDRAEVPRRHALYFLGLLRTTNAEQPGAEAEPRNQINNVRAALSWSFSPAGDPVIAVELAANAARLFLSLSLLAECQHWCERGVAALPETPRDTVTRLALQEALAISAMFTRGNGPEVQEGIERSLQLAERMGEGGHEMNLLAGLHIFLTRIGDNAGALEVGRRSVIVGNRIGAPGGVIVAEWMMGVSYHLLGDQAQARRYCEGGLERAATLDACTIDLFGYDHRVRALVALARASWLLGAADHAAEIARHAIEEAVHRADPINLCIALIYGSSVFLWRGDLDECSVYLARLRAHSARHSLGPYHAVGVALSGELAALSGQPREGVEALRSGLASLHADRHHVHTPSLERALAEALLQCGQVSEAALTITAALEGTDRRGLTFDLPELLRAQVQIGLASGRMPALEAESILARSIRLAQDQSAFGFALRSSMTLAELYAGNDRLDDAVHLLDGIYGRFEEGCDTMDLVRARALLGRWRAERTP